MKHNLKQHNESVQCDKTYKKTQKNRASFTSKQNIKDHDLDMSLRLTA